MASAMTVLAYGGITYQEGYKNAGQFDDLQDAVKWGTDYLLKAHVSPNEFYCQVGNGDIDHAYPGRPESMTVNRPAYSLTPSKPGSDCAGESAASLASAAILFKDTDPTYSATLIEHAKDLFNFADTYRGIYSNSIPDAAKFYKYVLAYLLSTFYTIHFFLYPIHPSKLTCFVCFRKPLK